MPITPPGSPVIQMTPLVKDISPASSSDSDNDVTLAASLNSVQNSPDNSARSSLYASAHETIMTSQLLGEDEKSPIQVDYSAVELGDPCHANQPFEEYECTSLRRFMSYERKNDYALASVKPNGNKLEVRPPKRNESKADFLVYQRTISGNNEEILYAVDPFKAYRLEAKDIEKKRFFGHTKNEGPAFPKHTDGKSKQAYDEYHKHNVPCIGIFDMTDRKSIERQQSLTGRVGNHLAMTDSNPKIAEYLKQVRSSEQIFFTIRGLDENGKETFWSQVQPESITNFLKNSQLYA